MATEPIFAFTISRKEWLRGEGAQNSFLLRESDGKRCCVGIYAKALGVPDDKLCGCIWPDPRTAGTWDAAEAPWLLSHWDAAAASEDRLHLPISNDSRNFTSEIEREHLIAEEFAKHGVEVTFED